MTLSREGGCREKIGQGLCFFWKSRLSFWIDEYAIVLIYSVRCDCEPMDAKF